MPLILFFDMFACLFVRNFLPAANLRRKIGARETLARRPAPVTTRERPTEPPRAPGPSARRTIALPSQAAVAWTWTSFSLIFYAICEELKWPEAWSRSCATTGRRGRVRDTRDVASIEL